MQIEIIEFFPQAYDGSWLSGNLRVRIPNQPQDARCLIPPHFATLFATRDMSRQCRDSVKKHSNI